MDNLIDSFIYFKDIFFTSYIASIFRALERKNKDFIIRGLC